MARSPVKRFFGTLLFVIAVLMVLAFLAVIYAASVNDSNFPFTDDKTRVYVIGLIILGLIAVILLLLILVRRYDRRDALSSDAEAFFIPETDRDALARLQHEDFQREFNESTTYATGPDIVVYNLPVVPLMGRAWDEPPKQSKRKPTPLTWTYFYPRSVERAVYVNDYIDIDGKGNQIKLRTLLAGPKDADKKDFDPKHTIKKSFRATKKKEAASTNPPPSAPGAESPAPSVPGPLTEDPFAPTAGNDAPQPPGKPNPFL